MLDQNCWASLPVWAFAELAGLQRTCFILILSLLRRLPAQAGFRPWALGFLTGWPGGASLEGDDGLKDASESVNPGRLGKDPLGEGQ